MKIALDARWIFPEISGIGNYTRQLLTEFGQIAPDDISFVLLFNDADLMRRTLRETNLEDRAEFEAVRVPRGVFSPAGQLLLPGRLKQMGIDLFHSPNYMIPLRAFPRNRAGRIRCITTIHDLIPLLFPDHAPKSKKSRLFPVFKALMLEIGRRSDAVITVSEASRRDILRLLKIPPQRSGAVHTVYNGVSPDFSPAATEKRHDDNRERTLLYVGRADPYKNLTTLVQALALLNDNTNAPAVKLLIAGSRDERYPEAENLARELGLNDKIEWTGYLSDSELIDTYRSADLLVHPSRYEGFGLQIIEAMACGTPVVCSNAGSLPEVAGDAAITVDPDDVQGFAAAISKVLTDPQLSRDMTARGLRQAQKFTWRKSAEQTLQIYRQTIQ